MRIEDFVLALTRDPDDQEVADEVYYLVTALRRLRS
jgi:hypothetical protein